MKVAKSGYEGIAHDPKSPYAFHRCQGYLNPAEIVDACWNEYRTMKPIPFTICGWKR